MQILRPGSIFKIVWVISDPSDATTYYPQAVIINSLDGTTIDTVNLVLESTGRYSYNWQVTADRGGQGTEIDITVKIYTDAAHTSPAGNYAQENRVYNIFDLTAPRFGSPGGGVDYDIIDDLIKNHLAKIIIPSYDERLSEIALVLRSQGLIWEEVIHRINSMNNLEFLKVSFDQHGQTLKKMSSDLFAALGDLRGGIDGNGRDLIEAFQNAVEAIGTQVDEIQKYAQEVNNILAGYDKKLEGIPDLNKTAQLIKNLSRAMASIKTVTVKETTGLPDLPAEPEEIVKPKKDYSKLAQRLVLR